MFKLIRLTKAKYCNSFCLGMIIFLGIIHSNVYCQVKDTNPPLIIEIEEGTSNYVFTIEDMLDGQLILTKEESESICSNSIIIISFTVDKTFNIHSTFSDNTPVLIKNKVIDIFRRWSVLKSMQDDVKSKTIIVNKVYLIPIIFYFPCPPKSPKLTFKTDYQIIGKYLKKMNWKNTEMLNFIMRDYRR